MGEVHYLISDASKKVDVETHVLRYWEEELEIQIPRNEMGHRYYTEEIIKLFRCVKELKEQGYQLKAIKNNLPKIKEHGTMEEEVERFIGPLPFAKEENLEEEALNQVHSTEIMERPESQDLATDDKMMQFQMIMSKVVAQALKENTQLLSKEVGGDIGDRVIKEMDYLMRVRDEKEEERFRKLDETLRTYQLGTKEAAATKVGGFNPKKKKRFGRRGNKLY